MSRKLGILEYNGISGVETKNISLKLSMEPKCAVQTGNIQQHMYQYVPYL
jgi:hypothetical protein